jgi:alginate O-acetyltransferase complex protein AlgJ
MGWGEGAGFAEQLSYHLRRPLDRIVINAGGSHTTRQQLRRELARGKDRLAGKRLVIWQFAMRDLMEGDWKLLPLPEPPRRSL